MGIFAAVAWNSRSRLGGPITGSGASYLSGECLVMASITCNTGSGLLDAWSSIGICAAPLLRLCQNHGCRDIAACAPELNLSKTPAIVGSGHHWKLTNCAHLFWLIPRDDPEEKWSCEVFNIDVTQAHALQHRGSSGTARAIARAFSVAVPALRNTRAIAKGDKVVFKWPKPEAVAKPPPTRTTPFSNANKLAFTSRSSGLKRQKLIRPSEQGGPSR